MKHVTFVIATALLVAAPAYATYDEALSRCLKFAEDNDTSPEPCECIAKAIGDDPELFKEEQTVNTLDDFANASEAYRDAVNPCLPEDQRAN